MHPISPPPPPPQSYSRIHRPWIDQDGTVTSSTHAADSLNSSSSSCSGDDHSDHDDSMISDNSMDNTIGDHGPPPPPPPSPPSQAAQLLNSRLSAHLPSVSLPCTPPTASAFSPLPTATANSAFTTPPHQLMYGGGLAGTLPATPHFGYPPAYPNVSYLAAAAASAHEMEHAYQRVLAEEARAKQLSARKQRPKRFVCTHCCVAFSNNGQLQGHIRIHTGERPYRCDDAQCGKTFTRNEELTRHKRIHSGVRPYACDTCGKRFGRRDHLKKHARTHLPVLADGSGAQLQYHHNHHASFAPFGLMGAAAAAASSSSASSSAMAAAVAAAMMPMYPYIFG